MFIRYQEGHERGLIPWTRVHTNRLIKAGEFPAPIRIGANTIAWDERVLEEHWASKSNRNQRAA